MSGMKFRRTCSVCNATFFSPDRKAAYCLKCLKKRVVKHVPPEPRAAAPMPRVVPRAIPKPAVAVAETRRHKTPRAAKVAVLTSELRERVLELYREQFAGRKIQAREVHTQIANKLWMKRQLVADVIRDLVQPKVVLTEDLRERAIEMYQRFVESGHRPAGGRRRAISAALGLPYKQVMKAIREWSMVEYSKSPNPNPSREQLFEIEKTYWFELNKKRYRLTEFPDRIAEQLGFVTRWQVLRWLDVLHDDQHAFDNVPDPPEEAKQQILSAYESYLDSTTPPEHGLHYSIAGQIPKVSPRQVHKVLQSYRHDMRSDYPLI
ncbi:MAG TPA: hypothetical protein VKM94_06100 [Blastocatellia bacterium]|nr:hypothetical protein [Blastocatellia bacterium]